jgi:hypothetical protein
MVIDSLQRRLEKQGLWIIFGVIFGHCMSGVQEWCDWVGLSVNPNKTIAILFTNKRNLNGYKKSTIFCIELKKQNQVKYLGVILDSYWFKVRQPDLMRGYWLNSVGIFRPNLNNIDINSPTPKNKICWTEKFGPLSQKTHGF